MFLKAFPKHWWESSTAGTPVDLYNACLRLNLDTLGDLVKTKKTPSVVYAI